MSADRSMLWSVVVGVLLFSADAQISNRPIIVSPPENEIILQSGQNYTLFCRGKRPMRFEQQEIPEENDGQFYKEQRNGSLGNESEYWVALDLLNVDRFAVGYYACYDDTIDGTDILKFIVEEPKNTENVTYTYVYVNDSSLVAPVRAVITAKIGSKFLIECKPTTPEINVTLTLDNKTIENDHYYYSPKVGFYVDSKVISFAVVHVFECGYVKQGLRESKDVFVNPLLAKTPEPTIYGGESKFLDGETFMINCTVLKPKQLPVDLQWIFPQTADLRKINESSNSDVLLDNQILYKNITVLKASRNEAGSYTCICNNDEETSKTFSKQYLDGPVLDVTRKNELVTKLEAKRVRLGRLLGIINDAYPKPTILIYRGNRSLTVDNIKYKLFHPPGSPSYFGFSILNVSPQDTDTYYIKYSNKYLERTLQFDVEVTGPPEMKTPLNTEKRSVKGSIITLQCEAVAFPLPSFQWIFSDESGVITNLENSRQINIENQPVTKYKLISKLKMPVNLSGNITCIASNIEGKSSSVQMLLVNEMDGGFGIKDSEKTWFSEGDRVDLQCLASLYDFYNVTWLDSIDQEIPGVQVSTNELSVIAQLTMDPISVAQEGLYRCLGTTHDGSKEVENITITVSSIQPPRFMGPEDERQTVNLIDKVNISCVADAVPPPTIEWYKDDSPLIFDGDKIIENTRNVNLTTVNSTIIIYPMQMDYAGVYECIVKSKDNERIKKYELIVNDGTAYRNTIYVSVAGVIFFFLIILVVYLTWKIKKEKQFRKELAAAGLLYFKEGVKKSINPDLGIDEQAELLPYDERFEFSAERLTIGKQLGAGAFGVVYKAEARGIVNAEETTTVAVKMVKKTADNMYIKALASELKIMVHLGKHINIVNLLGACTKKVGKRELIVIVEYCKFGNIHNYLQKHREVFIDQLNENTEKSLGKVNRGYSSSSGNTAMTSDYFGSNHTQETDNTFLNTANTNRSGRKVSETGYVQPEWRSNYESDYSFDGRSPRPLCSRDLLAWSFQVARGMEYLASKKILHGDLAARNILLAEDNVVKICDFGLARSIYKNDEYQKKENSPLPVKWLAIECVTDRIFTTQSDVWSFGIVLWEIFSLAKTPYPNISPPSLLQRLIDGYRLEKPAYANEKLYEVMKNCWLQKPTSRPSFTQLQEILGAFLEDNVRNHYVDLNATYMDMNKKQEGEEDYLAMVSAPDYNNLMTPSPRHHYANDARSFFPGTPTQLQHDDEGYLQMSPASRQTLFNARPQGTKFDFDARKLTPRVSEANSYGSESTPMLTLNNLPRSGSESDHEGNASPYMNMCTKICEETDDDVFGTKENNEKNMQPIISVDNPTYITLGDDKKQQKFVNNYTNLTVPNGLVK